MTAPNQHRPVKRKPKHVAELEKRLGRTFDLIEKCGPGHLGLWMDGRRCVVASTPSCPHAINHIIGYIRRANQQGAHRAN